MTDANTIMRERQLAARREIDRRGIALKAVSLDSTIPYPTLLSYFPAGREPAVIPMSAVYLLADNRALPFDVLNLLMPAGVALVQVPEGIDYDELADAFADFLKTKNDFHHPDSECGRDIGPREADTLAGKVVALPIAGRVR